MDKPKNLFIPSASLLATLFRFRALVSDVAGAHWGRTGAAIDNLR